MTQYSVLITDDSPTFLAVTKKFLLNRNYQVFTATDHEQAWKILEEQEIDILVVDWEMPQSDGISFIRLLRSNWKYFDLPIIIITARNTPEDVLMAMNAGCDDFLSKEEPMEILDARIQRLLFFLQRLQIERRKTKQRTVLVVDDSPTFLATTKNFLSTHKFLVVGVSSAASALEKLQQQDIDLLVVDWLMPEMDGLQLVQKIRSNKIYQDVPIIMISSKNDVEDVATAIELGVDDFISKDTDLRLLEKKIGVLLRIQEQHRRYTCQILEEKRRVEELVQKRTEQLQKSNENLKNIQVQLIHAEKMAGLGQMVAGIAHEINNPLGFIKSNQDSLELYLQDFQRFFGEYQKCYHHFHQPEFADLLKIEKEIELDYVLQDIQDLLSGNQTGIKRLANIVVSMRYFSRLDEGETKKDDVCKGIESSLIILEHQLKNRIQVVQELNDIPQIVASHG